VAGVPWHVVPFARQHTAELKLHFGMLRCALLLVCKETWTVILLPFSARSGTVYKATYRGDAVALKEIDVGRSVAMQQAFLQGNPCCAVLCCAVLCRAMPSCAVLCCAVFQLQIAPGCAAPGPIRNLHTYRPACPSRCFASIAASHTLPIELAIAAAHLDVLPGWNHCTKTCHQCCSRCPSSACSPLLQRPCAFSYCDTPMW